MSAAFSSVIAVGQAVLRIRREKQRVNVRFVGEVMQRKPGKGFYREGICGMLIRRPFESNQGSGSNGGNLLVSKGNFCMDSRMNRKKGVDGKMKRRTVSQKIRVLGAVSMMVAALAACGQKEGEQAPADTERNNTVQSEQEADSGDATGTETQLDKLNTEEYVSVTEYKGIEVAEAQPQVDEADKESYINYLLSMNPPEGVEEGDTVVIDYVGTLDGVAFEGGTASGAYLTIGSGQFIDGFESGLIGAKTGDTVELNLTFPKDYRSEDMAGKSVVFTVTINNIMAAEPQELTDEFVKNLALEECSNVAEFETYAYNMLYEEAVAAYESNVKGAIITVLMENSEFKKDPPQDMSDRYEETLIYNLTYQAESYGVSLADFMMMYYGMDEETYLTEIKNQAKASAQQYIMMQDIANKEGLTISDEEMNSSIEEMALEYGYASADDYKTQTQMNINDYKEYLMGQKVLNFLMENAVVTEPVAEESTIAEETTITEENSMAEETTITEEGTTAAEETLATE